MKFFGFILVHILIITAFKAIRDSYISVMELRELKRSLGLQRSARIGKVGF